ncbi:hypothetical protein LMG19282_03124 [Cupriavidus campinensis]|uniref:hypothetical protein n=1 Tax=Cupriavidus campinensis TaxID=151783 RepID=UPI001B03139C|nr:hypothetical protein [Cupriavidus campinensis]CAG2147294.1 hypothetical protein LMG19282_03124 [Cupriavidus campinensis]
MKWITDEDLKTWSRRTEARELFVDLVGDLIRATVADVRQFRFPGQSTGTIRGFDGDLETTDGVSRVPAGPSKWEFGTTPTGKAKAQADYDKRTSTTSEEVMAANAFVMLNLHSWDTPRDTLVDWLAQRNAENKWREVCFIDGTALVSWLEEKPAVAARYARNVLGKAPLNGALSTDEFWERYSSSFKTPLSEKVLLCGRENEAKQLLEVLSGSPQNFTLAADSAEEVIAFAVAVIRSAPDEVRKTLEARTMIVETFEAAQFLLGMKDMTFLIWKNAEGLAGSLGQRGPTLTAATGQHKRQGFPVLQRPTASAMAEAMESMSIDRQEGYELAFKCGRSLTILRRLMPAGGIAPLAEWQHMAESLKPALLAGGWTADSDLDKEVVASLAGGTDYVAVESPVRRTLNMSDAPFDKIDQVWQARAPVDAFPYYGPLVDENDLLRLKAAVVRVLGHQAAQPKAEEKFSFSYQAPADYSNWLRDGLAYTLMLFAVMPEVGGLNLSGTTPQRFVDDVVRSLPEFGRTHHWILKILPQLSVVAEAAPVPFLEALEKSLGGQAEDALGLFQEPDDNQYFLSATSPHVYVLWALEILAWNPAYLPRVAIILGKLAAIDPGKASKNGNRPLASLRTIFLPWLPNTDADLNRRFIALDGLIPLLPDVAWGLLLQLMPRSHDTSMPTAKPKLRDTTPLEPEQITFGLVWETENRLVDRALALANPDERRVVELVEHLGSLQPKNRNRLMTVFDASLRGQSDPEGGPLWHELRALAARHEAFPEADWTLKGSELESLKNLLNEHRPSDVVAQARHLFDDWLPPVRGSAEDPLEDVEVLRAAELRRVYASLGVPGLLRLAKAVKLPGQMGQAFNSLDLPYDAAAELIFDLMTAGGDCYNLACQISGGLRYRDGPAWVSYFSLFIAPHCKSASDRVWLLANWPNDSETWAFVRSLGTEEADAYWREVGTLPWNASQEDLQEAIKQLRQVGRSLTVLNTLHKRQDLLDSQTLLSLLDECASEIAKGGGASAMLSYAVSEVFTALSGRTDVTTLEVAQREYIYLPLIEDSVKGLSVHALLAKEPAEYVQIIKDVFVSKDEERDKEPTAEERAKAKLSYRLLKSFHTIPGDRDGVIDERALHAWVADVRRLAAECGRGDIADDFVGQLLAHSSPDAASGVWPPAEVASVLELIASEIVERGIEVERFNMRGVYTKAPNEGGRQERDLASRYRDWASQAISQRTAAMLERIAEGWEESAKRADIAAEQGKLKR